MNLNNLAAWWQRRARLQDTRTALEELDARTLHDLGLDRSEIGSVAAEAAGRSERHRLLRFMPYYCLVAAACTSAVVVPDSLAPGANEAIAMTLPARGVQIYECRARMGDAGAYEWAFVAPDAELLDARGHVVGRHGAGPYWQALDGSRVNATVKARAEAPEPHAIPWLLLAAKSTGPAGTLSNVTSIQRVNTYGGAAPSDACTRETVGRQARVRYLAEYRFFTPRPER